MEHTTRTLIFDDGSPTALRLLERARPVSSEIVLVSVHESANHRRLEGEIASWGVRLTIHQLDRAQGIRHALEYAAEHSAMVAFVPDPGEHRGAMVRKAIQAYAKAPHFELPAVAIHIVRDGPVSDGPIVLVAQPDRDDGFANLLATAFAATVDAPLRTMIVGEELANERAVSVAPALSQEAADAIGRGAVTVLPSVHVGIDQTDAVLESLSDVRAAVVGFGGFDVRGRKWTAPDELPDSVLETELGQLVHSLVNDAACDVVIVIDGVRLRHGTATGFAFGLVAAAIVSGGVVAGGGVAGAAPPDHSHGQGYGYGRDDTRRSHRWSLRRPPPRSMRRSSSRPTIRHRSLPRWKRRRWGRRWCRVRRVRRWRCRFWSRRFLGRRWWWGRRWCRVRRVRRWRCRFWSRRFLGSRWWWAGGGAGSAGSGGGGADFGAGGSWADGGGGPGGGAGSAGSGGGGADFGAGGSWAVGGGGPGGGAGSAGSGGGGADFGAAGAWADGGGGARDDRRASRTFRRRRTTRRTVRSGPWPGVA